MASTAGRKPKKLNSQRRHTMTSAAAAQENIPAESKIDMNRGISADTHNARMGTSRDNSPKIGSPGSPIQKQNPNQNSTGAGSRSKSTTAADSTPV